LTSWLTIIFMKLGYKSFDKKLTMTLSMKKGRIVTTIKNHAYFNEKKRYIDRSFILHQNCKGNSDKYKQWQNTLTNLTAYQISCPKSSFPCFWVLFKRNFSFIGKGIWWIWMHSLGYQLVGKSVTDYLEVNIRHSQLFLHFVN